MPTVKANGIEICYDTFGSTSGRSLLLIMGLGSQMIRWPEPFCQMLAERGHYVIRFDNRDIGLSTHLDHAGVPNITKLYQMLGKGEKPDVPYLLTDMAADTVGLMDALRLESSHIVGISMGGMIAQIIAIQYPKRVLSLVSIMSSTGRVGLPPPRDDVLAHVLRRPPHKREEAIAYMIETDRLIAGEGFPPEEERYRDHALQSIERGHNPVGSTRQLAAIMASGSRVNRLASITAPTLVIHGNRDPLVPIEAGRDTAACIPGARFMQIDRMGHYLSRPAWSRLVDAITEHTGSV